MIPAWKKVLWCLPNGDFLFLSYLHFFGWHSTVTKCFPFSPCIYLFNYWIVIQLFQLFISIWTHRFWCYSMISNSLLSSSILLLQLSPTCTSEVSWPCLPWSPDVPPCLFVFRGLLLSQHKMFQAHLCFPQPCNQPFLQGALALLEYSILQPGSEFYYIYIYIYIFIT